MSIIENKIREFNKLNHSKKTVQVKRKLSLLTTWLRREILKEKTLNTIFANDPCNLLGQGATGCDKTSEEIKELLVYK